MTRSTIDPVTERGPARRDGRVPGGAADAVVWAGVAILVAAAGCAVGLAAGRHLSPTSWLDVGLGDGTIETARAMAGLGGVYGLVVGGLAGLLLGGPARIRAGLKRGLAFAVVGAEAGGLGPLLSAATGGQLPAAGGAALGCALAGGVAGLVGFAWCRWRPKAVEPPEDWVSDPDLAERPAAIGRPLGPGSVVRQWPILAVSAGCLVVAVVTPPSPAGWPMLAVGLLGFAVAWVLAGQDRRMQALEQRLRERPDAGESVRSDP